MADEKIKKLVLHPQHHDKYVAVPTDVTVEEWMLGDFDKDGQKNIDEAMPLSPKSKSVEVPDEKKSRLTDPETNLSDQILFIRRNNESYRQPLRTFLRHNPGSDGRIKSVPSTIKKLSERYIGDVGDVAGARIITKNKEESLKVAKKIEKKYKTIPSRKDNFYNKPKGGVYTAYHLSVVSQGKPVEVQIRSQKMSKLADEMHLAYKKHESLKPFRKMARSLIKRGY